MPSLIKTLKPEHVIAVQDTREKTPLDLKPLKVITGTLATGDYSAKGFEHVIAIERKSINDLVMCVGRERDRFEKEIQRLLAYPVRAIVVSAHWIEIEQQKYRGNVHPNAALGSLLGWITRGIPIIMAGDHERAGRFVSRMIFTAVRRSFNETYPVFEAIQESRNAVSQ